MPNAVRSTRLIALAAVMILASLASLAIGASSRPHAVQASLSVPDLTAITAILLLVLAATVGLAIGRNFVAAWAHEPEYQELSRRKSKVPRIVRVLMPVLVLFAVAVVRMWTLREESATGQPQVVSPVVIPIPAASGSGGDLTLLIACVVIAIVAAILAAISLRRRFVDVAALPPRREGATAILDEGLDALLSERDPRKAVIAAYAAMERAMARQGWARRPAEAPTEYLGRVLGVAPERAPDLKGLVRKYHIARFSDHAVTQAMRAEAIESVKRLREDLELRIRYGPQPATAITADDEAATAKPTETGARA